MSSTTGWVDRARASRERQNPESQRIIDAFESLQNGNETSEGAARSIVDTLEPIVKENPKDLRTVAVWGILCDAIRAEGSSQEFSNRVLSLLRSLQKIAVTDANGNEIKYDAGGRFWTDLPAFAWMFRDYGISVLPNEGMEINEWLAQATPFLNATSFAATCLASDPGMEEMSFYVSDCMSGAFEEDPELEARHRTVLYVPAASAWIMNAGKKVYALCKGGERGFSMQQWETWKEGFGHVSRDEKLEQTVRADAEKAAGYMTKVESEAKA